MSSNKLDSTQAQSLLERANQLARENGNDYISTEHLLFAILENKEVSDILVEMGLNEVETKKELELYFKSGVLGLNTNIEPKISQATNEVINRAVSQALLS